MDSENHFLRFLRVCFFFALRKKELSQEKQNKKKLSHELSQINVGISSAIAN